MPDRLSIRFGNHGNGQSANSSQGIDQTGFGCSWEAGSMYRVNPGHVFWAFQPDYGHSGSLLRLMEMKH
jgi:hypothetical protein